MDIPADTGPWQPISTLLKTHTHTLTRLRCLAPTTRGTRRDQNPKGGVTLNWVDEGEHEGNRWEMLFLVGWYNVIISLVGKATL